MRRSDGRVAIDAGRFTIEGLSRAGNETWFLLRELGLAFDIGRCPDLLVGLPRIFVTHAHLDHSLGIPFYFAQRNLLGLPCGMVYVPSGAADDFDALMTVHERLEGFRYEYRIEGLSPGAVVTLRGGLEVRTHAASHRIPSNAYEVVEIRRKLEPQYSGLTGAEIAQLRSGGKVVTREQEASLVFYTGDTDREILQTNEAIFRSAVLMIECSFTGPEDRQRAVKYRHIHIEDLYDFADRFENELIVLTHFSLRDSASEIHARLSARCPATLRQRIRLALPEPFVRIG